jgi:DMSO reductase anchor subunit
MDFSYLREVAFLLSLGYVTLFSSLITLVVVGIIKLFLKQIKVIKKDMNPTKKDILLSRIGRIIALITYASIYIIDVIYIRHTELVFDASLVTSLLSGSALTLCISKGIYTGIRQMQKKKDLIEKVEVAEETIYKLQQEIKELNIDLQTEEPKENKWVLKAK